MPLQQADRGLPLAHLLRPAAAQLIPFQSFRVGNGQGHAEGRVGQNQVELAEGDMLPAFLQPLPGVGQAVQAVDVVIGVPDQAELGPGEGCGEAVSF